MERELEKLFNVFERERVLFLTLALDLLIADMRAHRLALI